MSTHQYEPGAGTHIDKAVSGALKAALEMKQVVTFEFNGREITVYPDKSEAENILAVRRSMGFPDVDPPFHPVTAEDALKRWDEGRNVFTIEMGGLGPGYEQAIQILVFEIIRDELGKTLPSESDDKGWSSWGDKTVSRINDKMGGFSGAQVGAAKQVAFRALRDGWGKMVESIPKDRLIQVTKSFPVLP